jgi:8-oxo-dGTP diphosphatase
MLRLNHKFYLENLEGKENMFIFDIQIHKKMKEKKEFCYKYPHPAVTTDNIIFGFDGDALNLLLVQRGIEPYKGCWAFPGGFLNMDETAEEGAARELKEETNMSDVYMQQLQAFSTVNRDPRERVITIAFYALVRQKAYRVISGDDAADVRWFNLKKLPSLAFDHDRILKMAVERLKERIYFEPIGFRLLDENFTVSDLKRLYELILGVKFDCRSFLKKMLSLNIITPLNEKDTFSHATQLYSFNEENYKRLKKEGMRLEF